MALLESQQRAAIAVAVKFGLPVERWIEMFKCYVEHLRLEERRARREGERAFIERARKDARVGDPTGERQAKGDLIDAEALPGGSDAQVRLGKFTTGQAKKGQAGGTIQMKVSQDPIDRYAARKQITPRQANAAGMLRDNYQLGILGARDPDQRDPYMVGHGWSGATYAEAHLKAAKTYARYIRELGPSLAPIIIAVVCDRKTIEELCESREDGRAKTDGPAGRARYMWALRYGLDRLGDACRLPGEIVEEKVFSEKEQDSFVAIRYRHEADGRVSGISFDGLAWMIQVDTLGELRAKALERMPDDCALYNERLILAAMGPGGRFISDPCLAGYWVQHEGNESRHQHPDQPRQTVKAVEWLDTLMDEIDSEKALRDMDIWAAMMPLGHCIMWAECVALQGGRWEPKVGGIMAKHAASGTPKGMPGTPPVYGLNGTVPAYHYATPTAHEVIRF